MKIAGVILAGGQSTRMGGVEKSLAKCGPKTLIQTTAERLRKQVRTIVVNANGNPNRFKLLGCEVISDDTKGYEGPLAGIRAGLKWAHANGYEGIVTVAADTPFFPNNLVKKMKSNMEGNQVVIAKTDRLHPVFGIWDAKLHKKLDRFLGNQDSRKIMAFVEKNKWESIKFQDTGNPFFNVNTPDDLRQAKKMMQPKPIIFGVTGWKNSGKTTLVEKLVREFVRRKKRVNTIKHASKQFEIDKKGSDSYRHAKAGSTQTVLIAQDKWVIMSSTPKKEAGFEEITKKMDGADVVLVEGFKKNQKIPKIECVTDTKKPVYKTHKNVVALATKGNISMSSELPQFNRNDVKAIADFVLRYGNKK